MSYKKDAVNKEKCCGRPLSPVPGRGSAHFPHFLLPRPQIVDLPPSPRQGEEQNFCKKLLLSFAKLTFRPTYLCKCTGLKQHRRGKSNSICLGCQSLLFHSHYWCDEGSCLNRPAAAGHRPMAPWFIGNGLLLPLAPCQPLAPCSSLKTHKYGQA